MTLCSCCFSILHEYADICTLVYLDDDKHHLQVGEPGFPLAAAERVLALVGSSFKVGDHNFTKYSQYSTISFVDCRHFGRHPFSGSCYSGQVLVGLKDATFKPSSPKGHAAELGNILSAVIQGRVVLLIYSDGGPNHRVAYVSIQLALI